MSSDNPSSTNRELKGTLATRSSRAFAFEGSDRCWLAELNSTVPIQALKLLTDEMCNRAFRSSTVLRCACVGETETEKEREATGIPRSFAHRVNKITRSMAGLMYEVNIYVRWSLEQNSTAQRRQTGSRNEPFGATGRIT